MPFGFNAPPNQGQGQGGWLNNPFVQSGLQMANSQWNQKPPAPPQTLPTAGLGGGGAVGLHPGMMAFAGGWAGARPGTPPPSAAQINPFGNQLGQAMNAYGNVLSGRDAAAASMFNNRENVLSRLYDTLTGLRSNLAGYQTQQNVAETNQLQHMLRQNRFNRILPMLSQVFGASLGRFLPQQSPEEGDM